MATNPTPATVAKLPLIDFRPPIVSTDLPQSSSACWAESRAYFFEARRSVNLITVAAAVYRTRSFLSDITPWIPSRRDGSPRLAIASSAASLTSQFLCESARTKASPPLRVRVVSEEFGRDCLGRRLIPLYAPDELYG